MTPEQYSKIKDQLAAESERLNFLQHYTSRTDITNIKVIRDSGIIIFQGNGVDFWAKLTKTGKIKKNSIRIDN